MSPRISWHAKIPQKKVIMNKNINKFERPKALLRTLLYAINPLSNDHTYQKISCDWDGNNNTIYTQDLENGKPTINAGVMNRGYLNDRCRNCKEQVNTVRLLVKEGPPVGKRDKEANDNLCIEDNGHDCLGNAYVNQHFCAEVLRSLRDVGPILEVRIAWITRSTTISPTQISFVFSNSS